jgi:hypothetical protein
MEFLITLLIKVIGASTLSDPIISWFTNTIVGITAIIGIAMIIIGICLMVLYISIKVSMQKKLIVQSIQGI